MNPSPETPPLSFGRYLKSKRIERGVSLKTVAGETRIGLGTLIQIENEEIGKLPAEVFTKGFLRAYAKAVGADGDEAVRRYLSELNGYRKAEKFEFELNRSSTRFWPRILLAFLVMAGIITGTVYLFGGPEDRLRIRTAGGPAPPVEKKAPVEAASKPQTVPGAAGHKDPVPDRLLLKVAAVKETWMKVIIDGQDTQEYRLNAGDHLELEAVSAYNILVGDAKGIRLTLNNKPFHLPGKSGQVVTVQIP